MALAKLDSERMAIEDSIRKSSLTQISPKTDSSIKKSEIKDPEASLKVELGNLRSALSALKTEIDRIEIERTKKTSKVEESRRSLDSMRGSLEQLESDVSQEDRDLDTLKTRGQALTKKIDEFDSSFKFLNENRDRLKTALASAVARTTTLEGERTHRESLRALTLKERDTALSNAGFTSVEECLECAISGADLSVLEKSVRDFERDSSLNAAKLSELTAKARTPAPTEEEVLALQTERAHALEKQTQILAEKLHLENSLRSMSAMKERISSMSAESEKLTLEHGKLGRLAEIAAGRHPNLSRVSFQRYVLAARLDEVLEQASRRLFTMSRGQFILRRSTSVEDKRRSAGLDVEVEDALSGKTRPTSSLSGGEGFLASLALAMGLSDVVQAHLGGVRLDAVFVDEGFGTLDPEALDLAMEVLSGLRSGGRIVGIISHVPELKDQIANRLVVRKSNAGSSVSWETSFV